MYRHSSPWLQSAENRAEKAATTLSKTLSFGLKATAHISNVNNFDRSHPDIRNSQLILHPFPSLLQHEHVQSSSFCPNLYPWTLPVEGRSTSWVSPDCMRYLSANWGPVLCSGSCISSAGYAGSNLGCTSATAEARHLSIQRAGLEHPFRLSVTPPSLERGTADMRRLGRQH